MSTTDQPRRCSSILKGRACERDDALHFAPTVPEDDRLHMAGPPGTPERVMWYTLEDDQHRRRRRGCSVEGCPNDRARICGEHSAVWPCRSTEANAGCWKLSGSDCAWHASLRAQNARVLRRERRPRKVVCERCGGPWKNGRCATCEACSWCGRTDVRASGSPPRCDVCFEIERIGLAVAYLCTACGEDLEEDAIPCAFEPRFDALEGHAVDTLVSRCPHCGEDAVGAVDVTDLSHLPEPPDSEWRLLAELLAEAA